MSDVKFRDINSKELDELVGKVVIVEGKICMSYGILYKREGDFYVESRLRSGSLSVHRIQEGELLTYREEDGRNLYHRAEMILGEEF